MRADSAHPHDIDLALQQGVLHTHPYPGRLLREWIIPPMGYSAFTLQKGDVLRLVDIEGKQVPDLVCFNANDRSDRLSQSNSQLLNKRRDLVRGNVLYSV